MLGWIHQPLECQPGALWSIFAFLLQNRKLVCVDVSACLCVRQEAEAWFGNSMVLKAEHVLQSHRGEDQISAMG